MALGLYKFVLDWGRHGRHTSLFVAEEHEVLQAQGKDIDFGSAFGKHSEVRFVLGASDNKTILVTRDLGFIKLFRDFDLCVGMNPLTHFAEVED